MQAIMVVQGEVTDCESASRRGERYMGTRFILEGSQQ